VAIQSVADSAAHAVDQLEQLAAALLAL
jgi:hypothetical protein